MNGLADLTPEDWAALAAVPEGARELIAPILPEEQYVRMDAAGIVHPLEVAITPYGLGVIAAARVLVKRAEPQPGLVHCPYGGICALCTTTCAEARARARDRVGASDSSTRAR